MSQSDQAARSNAPAGQKAPAQLAKQANYYRQLLASNAKIAFILYRTCSPEGTQNE